MSDVGLPSHPPPKNSILGLSLARAVSVATLGFMSYIYNFQLLFFFSKEKHMLASLPLKNSISGLVLAHTLLPERHHASVINLTYMSFNILFLKRKIETEIVSLSRILILGSFTVTHGIPP